MIDRRALIGGGLAAGAMAVAPRVALAAPGRVFTSDIAVEENRIWLSAMVSGHGPYLFVIDTGGEFSLLDDDLARTLELKEIGQSNLRGVGGVSNLPYYNAGDVLFGSGIRLPNMLFAGTHSRLGQDAVGTFGAGLFTSFDSDLDFVKGEWRAYPDGRPNFDGLTRLKSRFSNRGDAGQRIYADATIGGFSGNFLLDTGSPGQASLEGPATAKAGLWNDDRPYAPIRARGIGKGSVASRLVRLDRMTMAPFAFERPIVLLSKPGSPNHYGDGIIGLSTLRQLNLSTQVSGQSLWAADNHLRPWPERYARSGLLLEEDKGRITIADVGTGSPAAQAGLKAGDTVVGAPLAELAARANGRAGSQMTLTIERDGKRSDASFTLADYL